MDLARALGDARQRSRAIESDLHFQRLARELARELSEIGGDSPAPESGPLLDMGPREQRFRVAMAGHMRGDYDEKRGAAHYRIRDESSI